MSYFSEKDEVFAVINDLCDEKKWKIAWNSSNIANDGSSLDSGALSLSCLVGTAAADCNGGRNSAYLINTLNAYSEQPNIIRAVVREMVSPVMDVVDKLVGEILHSRTDPLEGASEVQTRSPDMSDKLQHVHILCKVLYVICKVVGYKHVMKHLPHEVRSCWCVRL